MEKRDWWNNKGQWLREGTYATRAEAEKIAATLKAQGYDVEVNKIQDSWKSDPFWYDSLDFVVYFVKNKLSTQQIGQCGELLVQYLLLKCEIESAHLTTDTGIDLVAYPRSKTKKLPSGKPITIQVKASTPRGEEGEKWIHWSVSEDCPADCIAMVDISRNMVWFFPSDVFKDKLARRAAKGYLRLWWYI